MDPDAEDPDRQHGAETLTPKAFRLHRLGLRKWSEGPVLTGKSSILGVSSHKSSLLRDPNHFQVLIHVFSDA